MKQLFKDLPESILNIEEVLNKVEPLRLETGCFATHI